MPTAAPITSGRKIITGIIYSSIAPPETCRATIEITVKNTATPTISSSAAIGISVFVSEPLVLNSLTIESAGAGAVARAIPPKMNAR